MPWVDKAVDKFMNKWQLPTGLASFQKLFMLATAPAGHLTPGLYEAQVLAAKGENPFVPSLGPALSTTTNLKD
jgi:hypothetical protein